MPRTTTADGVEIAYETTGSGPPVVLVHGITEERRVWGPVIDRLASDHRCVALDLRGHGESGPAGDYSSLAMVQDVAAVVADAGIEEPPACIGHSLGGMVVTVYAATAPVRAVVNVDQSARLGALAGVVRQMEPALRGPDFHTTLVEFFHALGEDVLAEDQRATLRAYRAHADPEVVLGVWEAVFTSTDDELDALVTQVLSGVQAPYLALHGSDPGEDYAAWLRDRAPSATVEVWPDTGHWLHLADTDRFVDRVRAFLA